MTVVGSNAAYRTLRADRLARVPAGLDAAEAATLILSWTTAYQLLHRAARVQRGQRVLVHGAAGAVGQALLALGRLAGLELWGAARGEHAALIRELGATPIDYQREDFTRVLPGGFDIVFDGIGEDGYRRSFAALKRGGLLCAIGYSAGVQAQRSMLSILMWIARLYLWRWLPGGKRARFYSINVMRARHPAWFREDLERLFEPVGDWRHPAARCRAHLLRRGRRGTPPSRSGRSRGQARPLPGSPTAARAIGLALRSEIRPTRQSEPSDAMSAFGKVGNDPGRPRKSQSRRLWRALGSVAAFRSGHGKIEAADGEMASGGRGEAGRILQGAAIHRRGDPLGGPLIPGVPDQLPRSRADAG